MDMKMSGKMKGKGDAWHSVIFMKTEKSMDEMKELSKWNGIGHMWSMSGPFDWCIQLDSSSPDDAEMMTERMLRGNWATETQTHWWKEVHTQNSQQ